MAEPQRLISLDQFRGYTVLGMFLVNFIGSYNATPTIFRHQHTFCSYADTIMPQFLFCVGFALRLVYLKRLGNDGPGATYGKLVKRALNLVLLAIVVHHFTGELRNWKDVESLEWQAFLTKLIKRGPFETLGHIAVTTLFILPVIGLPGWVRILYAAAAAGLHVWLSFGWYYEWVWPHVGGSGNGIDGGPLGFLSWTIAAIFGSLAHDWMVSETRVGQHTGRFLLVGLLLMLLAYGLSCLQNVTPPNSVSDSSSWTSYLADPPFCPPADQKEALAKRNYWVMAQRPGSITYVAFCTGLSFWLLVGFRYVCDGAGVQFWLFELFGQHALAGYIIHGMVGEVVKPFVPRDAPLWYVMSAFAINLGLITLMLRYLDRHRLYLRL